MRIHRLEIEAFGPFATPQHIDFDRVSAQAFSSSTVLRVPARPAFWMRSVSPCTGPFQVPARKGNGYEATMRRQARSRAWSVSSQHAGGVLK